MFLRLTLPCFGKTKKNNVGPVLFDGGLSITQKSGGNRCIFQLDRADYILNEKRFVLGSAQDDEQHMFVGHFQVIRPGTSSIDTDKDDDASTAQASGCPLASLSSTFKEIRLVVDSDHPLWRANGAKVQSKPDVLRGQLTQLCTGHSSANPESQRAKIVETDIKALQSESTTQEDQLDTMRCQNVTHAGKGEDKGKGKEADLPVAPVPVRVSASEKLKAFTRGADEKRKAAKAAKEVELAEVRSKHAAEMAALEQMWAERLRLVEEDIASDEAELHSLLENYLPVVSNRTLNQ